MMMDGEFWGGLQEGRSGLELGRGIAWEDGQWELKVAFVKKGV